MATQQEIKEVLLVDDNHVNLLIAEKMLKRNDYNVSKALNGYEGVEQVKLKKFDVILMDLFMPGMDGYTTSGEIRKIDSDTIILALSSTDVGVSEEKMQESGINGFLSKPFSIEELSKKLTELGHGSKEVLEDNNIKSAIFDITKGKDEFKVQLIDLYINNIKELQDHFTRGIIERDSERLNFITHKIKTTVKMLKLDSLDNFIKNSINLMETNTLDTDKFQSDFDALCSELIGHLTNLKDG